MTAACMNVVSSFLMLAQHVDYFVLCYAIVRFADLQRLHTKVLTKKANILFYFSLKFKFVPDFWDFFYLNHSFLARKAWFWKIDFRSESLFSTIVSFCSQNIAFHPLLFVAT